MLTLIFALLVYSFQLWAVGTSGFSPLKTTRENLVHTSDAPKKRKIDDHRSVLVKLPPKKLDRKFQRVIKFDHGSQMKSPEHESVIKDLQDRLDAEIIGREEIRREFKKRIGLLNQEKILLKEEFDKNIENLRSKMRFQKQGNHDFKSATTDAEMFFSIHENYEKKINLIISRKKEIYLLRRKWEKIMEDEIEKVKTEIEDAYLKKSNDPGLADMQEVAKEEEMTE